MADRTFESAGQCDDIQLSPIVIATDGGLSRNIHSSAFIGTDGRWGVKSAIYEKDTCAPACSLGAELRAIYYGLQGSSRNQPIILQTDSRDAQRLLARWQNRKLRMPPWYDLQERKNGERPTLLLLRNRVSKSKSLTVVHTKGHSGELLNEAADGLATIGLNALRNRYNENEAKRRCASMAASFLLSYRQVLEEQK